MAVAAADWEALHPSKVVTEMILLLGFAARYSLNLLERKIPCQPKFGHGIFFCPSFDNGIMGCYSKLAQHRGLTLYGMV